MNSKQLQMPVPAGKSAPLPLTPSTSHHSSENAKMLPWDDPKDLFYFNSTDVSYSVQEQ